jgi:cytochrome c556
MPPTRLLGAFAIALATLAAAPDRSKVHAEQPQKLPTQAEIMAAKVKHSQVLLDALAREDFKRIKQEATALARISDAAEFLNAHKTDDYRLQTATFRQSVATMADKAEAKNIDGVLLAYLDMSARCVKCHQYTRTRKRD